MDLDVSESASVPAPARHYGTRSSNATRRPAIDIGLDWEASQRERLEQEAEKARKKEQTKAKRRSKAEHRERESKGIEKLAALELARDKADEAERLHVKSTTARGYRKPEVEVEEDGHDGRRSASSVSSGDVYEEPQDPQAPSSLDGNSDADMPDVTPMKTKGQRKSAKQRKQDRQAKVLGRIKSQRLNPEDDFSADVDKHSSVQLKGAPRCVFNITPTRAFD
ncbi:hypothetical protein TRAPUB_14213 [Trametes pubescens]|uniref:Uncharacterized protein n=1 Tax=Trametes pubescens TaxID=154538 RepID=A0A1M2VP64_TRAPU|nr:hypothetical protein TRAPUB_14213 [Trametes pubescens]